MRVMKPSLQVTHQPPSSHSPSNLAIKISQQTSAIRRICSGATFWAEVDLTFRSSELNPERAWWLYIPVILKNQLPVSLEWRPYQSGGEHTRPILCKGVAYASLN